MKFRTTKKAIREGYNKVFAVSYCTTQNLFRYHDPVAYSTRAEGWACDYYDIGNGVVISEGYSPTGEHINYDVVRSFDDKAAKILIHKADLLGDNYEQIKAELEALIIEFRNEITK
jgi:hypothetical protein